MLPKCGRLFPQNHRGLRQTFLQRLALRGRVPHPGGVAAREMSEPEKWGDPQGKRYLTASFDLLEGFTKNAHSKVGYVEKPIFDIHSMVWWIWGWKKRNPAAKSHPFFPIPSIWYPGTLVPSLEVS